MGPFNILVNFDDQLYAKAIAARLALERPGWVVTLDDEGADPDLTVTDSYPVFGEHPGKSIYIKEAVSLSALLAKIDSYRLSRGLMGEGSESKDPEKTKIICVAAPSGVKGCSVCGALLCQHIASKGRKVLFVSFDMAESVLFVPEGMDEAVSDGDLSMLLLELLRRLTGSGADGSSGMGDHLLSCIRRTVSGVHFFPPSKGLNPLFFLDSDGLQAFLELVCAKGGFDAVIADCPMEHPLFPDLARVSEYVMLIASHGSPVLSVSRKVAKDAVSGEGRLIEFFPGFDESCRPFDIHCQLGEEVSRFAEENGL